MRINLTTWLKQASQHLPFPLFNPTSAPRDVARSNASVAARWRQESQALVEHIDDLCDCV